MFNTWPKGQSGLGITWIDVLFYVDATTLSNGSRSSKDILGLTQLQIRCQIQFWITWLLQICFASYYIIVRVVCYIRSSHLDPCRSFPFYHRSVDQHIAAHKGSRAHNAWLDLSSRVLRRALRHKVFGLTWVKAELLLDVQFCTVAVRSTTVLRVQLAFVCVVTELFVLAQFLGRHCRFSIFCGFHLWTWTDRIRLTSFRPSIE